MDNQSSYYFMWAKRDCPYCQQAQQLLFEKQALHMSHLMDEQPQTLSKVKQHFNWNTVPIIIRQSLEGPTEFIGGYTELANHFNKNTI